MFRDSLLARRLFGGARATEVDAPVSELESGLDSKVLRKFASRYSRIVESCREQVSTDAPLLVGPWTSEVGFELLYWIPMLRFLHAEVGWNPDRATVVTRGGASVWYDGLASRSCDAFDVMTVDGYRAGTERRWKASHGSQKQKRLSELDDEIVRLASTRLALAPPSNLHPKVMYNSLNLYWTGGLGLEWYDLLTRFQPMPVPDLGIKARLPADYFAVKFYFRPSFPDTPDNRRFIDRFVAALSRLKPVVLLQTGTRVDDHAEYEGTNGDSRVIRLDLGGEPSANLALQTEVIARSSGFYGTYGGLTYLPMYFGLPSTGFVSDEDHVHVAHQAAASRACSVFRTRHQMPNARIRMLTIAEAELLAGGTWTSV